MKKIFISALAILFFQSVYSQDIKKVRAAFDKKDWAKSKEAVDLYLAGEKGAADWEGWYYKGLIYAQVAKDPSLKTTTQDAWDQSLAAYKKASQLDAKQVTTFMTIRNYPIFENYQELSKAGTELFNTGDFKGAVNKYKEADVVGRYIFENGWALTEIDTLLTYYIGAAALQADMTDEAVFYFQKIADREITGEGYDLCYRYLAYYFDKKGDVVLSEKYFKSGKKLYPEDPYYAKFEIDKERKKGLSPELFKKYEISIQKDPKDYDIRLGYAADLFDWLYTEQKGNEKEREQAFRSIVEQLNACSSLDATKTDPLTLLGKSHYNEAAAKQEQYNKIKSTAPADQKKKADIKTQMESNMQDAIVAFEKALLIFEKYTADELKKERSIRSDYKQTLYLLSECYKFLGDTKKAEMYLKKEETIK